MAVVTIAVFRASLLSLLLGMPAFGAVDVQPQPPYALDGDTIHYGVDLSVYPKVKVEDYLVADTYAGFHLFNLKMMHSGENMGSFRPNMVRLRVSSARKFDNPERVYIRLYVGYGSAVSRQYKYVSVPISAVGEDGKPFEDCEREGSRCRASSNGHFYAAKYQPGKQYIIGVYPKEVCRWTQNQDIDGCARGEVRFPGDSEEKPGRPTTLILAVEIAEVPAVQLDQRPVHENNLPKDLGPARILSFNGVAGSYECNTSALNSSYFPSDGAVLFNPHALTGRRARGGPGVGYVIVVGRNQSRETGAPETGLDVLNPAKNHLISRVAMDATLKKIRGFENAHPQADNMYHLAFLMRDSAGIMTKFVNGCSLNGVQTSAIKGFLDESKCFIATAAFRGYRNPAVEMLRKFRDQFLLRSKLGRLFVRFYYRWSPPAAEWVVENPHIRFPALLLLVPLQIIVWLIMHPGVLLVLSLGGLLLLAYALFPLSFYRFSSSLFRTRRRKARAYGRS